MKREIQIEESKDLIADAFMNLLKSKPFEAISLTEIANEAGVSRMTLHRHFKQKENIILYRIEKVVASMTRRHFENGGHSLEDDILYRFTLLKNLPHSKLLIHSEQVSNILYDIRFSTTKQLANTYFKNSYDKYLLCFFMGGVDRMVREWLKNDFDESPLEMTKKTLKMLSILCDNNET